MVVVLAFAVILLLAGLVSCLAHRSILSTAVLFLVAGFVFGLWRLVPLHPDNAVVSHFAELALFSVLFTDGMRVGVKDLGQAWRLPGRALLLGLPLTLLCTALLAHWIVGLPWTEAFLVGAVLSPTDPVFAAAIVGREEVPRRLRQLLNVESGLNDGLALPIVLLLLAVLGGATVGLLTAVELVLGIVVGVGIPWAAARLRELPFFAVTTAYGTLYTFAVGLIVLSVTSLTHANEFLAAFAAGITINTLSPAMRDEFRHFGATLAELFKLAALFVFGALISPAFLAEIPPAGYVFALLALVLARPVGLSLAFIGSRLHWREWVAAAWFGPKGFASVVFGLLVL